MLSWPESKAWAQTPSRFAQRKNLEDTKTSLAASSSVHVHADLPISDIYHRATLGTIWNCFKIERMCQLSLKDDRLGVKVFSAFKSELALPLEDLKLILMSTYGD